MRKCRPEYGSRRGSKRGKGGCSTDEGTPRQPSGRAESSAYAIISALPGRPERSGRCFAGLMSRSYILAARNGSECAPLILFLTFAYDVYIVYTILHINWRYKMTTQMIVRVNPELKNKVNSLAKAEGKSVSEVVRELLEDYVKNRDIGLYIDDLWQRVGDKLSNQKIGSKEINRAIREVRAEK